MRSGVAMGPMGGSIGGRGSSGPLALTPQYAAPERILGGGKAEPSFEVLLAADCYSFAVTCWSLYSQVCLLE